MVGSETKTIVAGENLKMNEFVKSDVGYIVYEDGGYDLYSYSASEKWFATYTEAIDYAMKIVNKRIKSYINQKKTERNTVIVYKGAHELLQTSHSCPCGQVIFHWSNYYKYKAV